MGNQLTVQSLKQNFYQYQPDLIQYDVVQNIDRIMNQNSIIWQHRRTNLRLVEKKYFARNWKQFNQILELFTFRYNNQFIVATRFIIVENRQDRQVQKQQKAFEPTWIRIFHETSITNLSYFKQIPPQDAGYFLLSVLHGFQRLVKKLGFPFRVIEQMFHITQSKKAKVWLCQQISQITDLSQIKSLKSQSQMVHQILSIVKQNIYFYPSKKEIHQQNVQNYLEPIIIDEIMKQLPQTIQDTIELLQQYLQKLAINVENQMTCLKSLNHDELANIIEMTRIKLSNVKSCQTNKITVSKSILTSKNQKSQIQYKNSVNAVIDRRNSFMHKDIYPHPDQMRKFNPVGFKNIKISEDKKQNDSINAQQNIKQNIKQSVLNEISNQGNKENLKVSRSKSHNNKKSGLSLVKNEKNKSSSKIAYKQCAYSNRNHKSLIVIKPSSEKYGKLNNYRQGNIVNDRFPPKFVQNALLDRQSKDLKQNVMTGQDYKQSKLSFPKKSRVLSNIHNQIKGIVITNKQIQKNQVNQNNFQTIQTNSNKGSKLALVSPGMNVVSCETPQNNKSLLNNNSCSSITIGVFPPPMYTKTSGLQNTSGNMVNIYGNVSNVSGNLVNTSGSIMNTSENLVNKSYQNFYNSSAFDPMLANQSLTRFHKQYIYNNSNGSQFYQVPKVYVNSPKNKNKIFRTQYNESECKYKHQTNNNNQILSIKRQQDHIKQSLVQKQQLFTKQQRKKFKEFHNHDQQRIFTDPKLYQYIKNNCSKQIINQSNHNNLFPQNKQAQRKQEQNIKNNKIDYLANVQISQSLDYDVAEQIFENMKIKDNENENKIYNKDNYSPQRYTINDFPTIQEIEENPYDQITGKQNASFLPIPLNLNLNFNANLNNNLNLKQLSSNYQQPPSSIRRGYEQSVVIQYKKFYDDTNRSNISPDKHYFSPLKKNNNVSNLQSQQINRKYATANNWRIQPTMPLNSNKGIFFKGQTNITPIKQAKIGQQMKNKQPSPTLKIIYKGEKPAINPLLLQDMQRLRQNRMY